MYLCLCRNLTESGFRRVIQSFVQSGASPSEVLNEETLIDALGLDDDECCGQCAKAIDRFVDLARREWAALCRSGIEPQMRGESHVLCGEPCATDAEFV
jgi:bacterioferritin-associated ferredoxin